MNKDLCKVPTCSNYFKYNRYCGHVGYSVPEPKVIEKVSEKRKELDKEYKKARAKFLKEHPLCMAALIGCHKKANQIHHMKGRATDEDYLNEKYFLSACGNCHEIIERNPVFSKKNGLSVSRLSKVVK